MTQEPAEKRALSAMKHAAHVYARNPSDDSAEELSRSTKALRELRRPTFWQGLKLTRTASTKAAFRGRRYQND